MAHKEGRVFRCFRVAGRLEYGFQVKNPEKRIYVKHKKK